MSPLDSAGEMAGVLGKADFPRYCASVKDRQLLDDESIEADFIARETRREERREAKAIACKARDTALRHALRIAGWQCPVVGPGIFRTEEMLHNQYLVFRSRRGYTRHAQLSPQAGFPGGKQIVRRFG